MTTREERAKRRKLGRCLREHREHRGLSQAALAAQVGVCQQTIDKYERGETAMPVTRLQAIYEALHLPLPEPGHVECPESFTVHTPPGTGRTALYDRLRKAVLQPPQATAAALDAFAAGILPPPPPPMPLDDSND